MIGIDILRVIYEDSLCYKCRKSLKAKVNISTFNNVKLITFYKYSNTGTLLIRYKDYLDKLLGPIFMAPYTFWINNRFKGYEIVLVPSSLSMKKRRGFNHLQLMLTKVDLNVIDCLIKTDTVQRFSTTRNVVFQLRDSHQKFDKVIIFDDVITSGNSLQAALDIILPKAKEVIIMCVIDNLRSEVN